MDGGVVEASRLQFPEGTLREWQEVVDLVAGLTGVRAALIMRVWESEDRIQVLVASQNAGNPYHPGEAETLHGSGLYCERVLETRQILCVPDALASPEWDHNPDLERGLVSYMGLPILQPDGRAFGTICILDDKTRPPDPVAVDLLHKMRNLVQGQLHLQERLRLQTLLADNALLRRLIDGLPTSVACSTLPPDARIIYLNQHFTRTFGYTLDDLPTLAAWVSRAAPVEGQRVETFDAWLAQVEEARVGDGRLPRLEHVFLTRDDEPRRVIVGATVLEDLLVASLVDITDLRRSEAHLRHALQEKEKAVAELSEALDRVRTLSGLLPICSRCKKVRDDEGYWQRIERYIEQRTEATFTHGLCPTCIQGLYPGLAQEMLTEE